MQPSKYLVQQGTDPKNSVTLAPFSLQKGGKMQQWSNNTLVHIEFCKLRKKSFKTHRRRTDWICVNMCVESVNFPLTGVSLGDVLIGLRMKVHFPFSKINALRGHCTQTHPLETQTSTVSTAAFQCVYADSVKETQATEKECTGWSKQACSELVFRCRFFSCHWLCVCLSIARKPHTTARVFTSDPSYILTEYLYTLLLAQTQCSHGQIEKQQHGV